MDLSSCKLCPRECGINRAAGETGFCGAGRQVEIFRAGPHDGEEPPISGSDGSGTIFFSRCTLQCIYCQNYPWSQCGEGELYDRNRLQEVLAGLADAGCHNWNLVSPTPWLPMIREAVEGARESGRNLPIVYNSSGFEKAETLEEFRDIADIYLLDLRYAENSSAADGSGCGDYPGIAREAFRKAWELAGPLEVDDAGIARSGVICRILVLPGKAQEALDNLRWLAGNFGNGMAVSIMSQYTPAFRADRGDWARRLTREEYGAVAEIVEELEFDWVWMQGFMGSTPDELIGYKMKKGIS